ncbi:MAG: hypothetical protein ABI896_09310 [Actinomycetota bacterium]
MGIANVLLVAAAFAATFWRYEDAEHKGRIALEHRGDRLRTEDAEKVFWHKREAINEYLVTKFHQEAESGQGKFLQKPFSATTLAETVRNVLDRPALSDLAAFAT